MLSAAFTEALIRMQYHAVPKAQQTIIPKSIPNACRHRQFVFSMVMPAVSVMGRYPRR